MSKKPLNPNARKWVKALRSGEYMQTKKQLINTRTGGMCCLGVACAVAMRNGVTLEMEEYGNRVKFLNGDYYEGDVLPGVVQDWLGLKEVNGGWKDTIVCLSSLNDSGKSFSQIADIIESQPEGLFRE